MPGTFFMACGFEGGYLGLQETSHGKLFIFSAWDNGGQLVTLSQLGDGARKGRFAGEGTGGQTFYDTTGSLAPHIDFWSRRI